MLIQIDPNIQSDPEPEEHYFGFYVFDTLPNIHAVPKEAVANMDDNAF